MVRPLLPTLPQDTEMDLRAIECVCTGKAVAWRRKALVIWDTQFTYALVYDLIGLSVSDSLSLSRQPGSDTVISFLEARRS